LAKPRLVSDHAGNLQGLTPCELETALMMKDVQIQPSQQLVKAEDLSAELRRSLTLPLKTCPRCGHEENLSILRHCPRCHGFMVRKNEAKFS